MQDPNVALEYILNREAEITNTYLYQICNTVITNDEFRKAPGSKEFHHAYAGGLMIHTAEVLETALKICESTYLTANKDVIVTSAICHDYGKIFEYTIGSDGKIAYTSHRNMIRHLSRSYAEFMKICNVHNFTDNDLIEKIGHCILAHHGRFEWGSPVEPQTIEAHILHFADMISLKNVNLDNKKA